MNTKIQNNELKRLNIEAYRKSEKAPIYVVLDNVRSAQNVGSIFRTMDAFRCAELNICGISAKPPHREINKTALGASESVKWKYFDNTKSAVLELKARNIALFAVEQTTSSSTLENLVFKNKNGIALVFGNEVEGVSQKIIDLCDGSIEVPQFGSKHSLNISVCAGIVIWDIFSKNYLENLAKS